MWDIRKLVAQAEAVVDSHQMNRPGAYRRWLWQKPGGTTARELELNPYGCADAANILYTTGRFPTDEAERRSWIEVLRSLQSPADGLFHESTHTAFHTTAHCIAALELFDARPRHPLKGMAPLRNPAAVSAFLNGLDWKKPWGESHKGAGLYASLILAGEINAEWEEAYFGWLWNEADPQTGFWRRGAVAPMGTSIFQHLAGSFHYLFNQEYARRPLRYPEKMTDSCLQIWKDRSFPALANGVTFADIDWVYCLTRSVRQSGHRFKESRTALRSFAQVYIGFLQGLDKATNDDWNDLHQLFGAMCALAELQAALPGEIRTTKPLRLVLDRRPFI